MLFAGMQRPTSAVTATSVNFRDPEIIQGELLKEAIRVLEEAATKLHAASLVQTRTSFASID